MIQFYINLTISHLFPEVIDPITGKVIKKKGNKGRDEEFDYVCMIVASCYFLLNFHILIIYGSYTYRNFLVGIR